MDKRLLASVAVVSLIALASCGKASEAPAEDTAPVTPVEDTTMPTETPVDPAAPVDAEVPADVPAEVPAEAPVDAVMPTPEVQ